MGEGRVYPFLVNWSPPSPFCLSFPALRYPHLYLYPQVHPSSFPSPQHLGLDARMASNSLKSSTAFHACQNGTDEEDVRYVVEHSADYHWT